MIVRSIYSRTLGCSLFFSVVFISTNVTDDLLSDTTVKTSVSTESDSTHTSLSSSSTSMNLTTTHEWDQPNSTVSEPSEEPQGLTSGQIAGIAVGSIAGVAALGTWLMNICIRT